MFQLISNELVKSRRRQREKESERERAIVQPPFSSHMVELEEQFGGVRVNDCDCATANS